jgi:hypothetical protein
LVGQAQEQLNVMIKQRPGLFDIEFTTEYSPADPLQVAGVEFTTEHMSSLPQSIQQSIVDVEFTTEYTPADPLQAA